MNETDQIRTTAEEDAITEAAVMRQLLALHPTQLSFDELLRDVTSDDFEGRDALERALRDLSAAGLLHRQGEMVVPSRAALHLDELLG